MNVLPQNRTTWRGPRVATAIDGMVELATNGMLRKAYEQGGQAGYEDGLVLGFRLGVVAASALIGAAGALVLVGRWWL